MEWPFLACKSICGLNIPLKSYLDLNSFTSEPAFLLGLRFPFTVKSKALSYNPTNELRIFSYYPLLHFWRNFDERMKFCQTATLWISNCATSWNFKLRLPAKYYTNSQKTNCSNSPINTAFRRGIIHFCQLFHWIVYFDKPQTAKLNYRYRFRILSLGAAKRY